MLCFGESAPKALFNGPMPSVAAQMTAAVTMHSVTIVLRGGVRFLPGSAGMVPGVGGAAYSYRCW
ncbi:hypothetical protein EDD92_9450 [Streptomyces sp. TLI_185]|nr:hypothetical protein EDD92_9450 [Streptomyces sp. TLI_185]